MLMKAMVILVVVVVASAAAAAAGADDEEDENEDKDDDDDDDDGGGDAGVVVADETVTSAKYRQSRDCPDPERIHYYCHQTKLLTESREPHPVGDDPGRVPENLSKPRELRWGREKGIQHLYVLFNAPLHEVYIAFFAWCLEGWL